MAEATSKAETVGTATDVRSVAMRFCAAYYLAAVSGQNAVEQFASTIPEWVERLHSAATTTPKGGA